MWIVIGTSEKSEIKIPVHLGIIMDGNGRWAKKRGLPRSMGHKAGAEALRRIISVCRDMGVRYVTCYAFSKENWKRPEEEVNALMKLFGEYLDEFESFAGKKSRVVFLGDKAPFPDDLRRRMEALENDTAEYSDMTIMLAMNYSGKDEIVRAAKKIAEFSAAGDIKASEVDEKLFSSLLYTGDAPDADLIIRTSGELRISNFLLWQSAYAEFYFTDVLWPDFDEKELKKAFEAYSMRSRRFGGV